MDVEIGVVAAEFGRAIVQAMVSDGWTTLRPRLGRVLRRGKAEHLVAAMGTDAAALGAGKLPVEVAAGRWAGRIEGLLHQHPELMDELAGVLAEIRAEGSASGEEAAAAPVVIRQTTGNRSQTTAGGRDVVNSNNSSDNRSDNRRKTSFGGIGIVVAVIAVLLLAGGVVINNVLSPTSSTIDADTSCADYLRAPQWERDQAVRQLAVDMGVSGAGHAFVVLNVDYDCGHRPQTRLGDVVARQQY